MSRQPVHRTPAPLNLVLPSFQQRGIGRAQESPGRPPAGASGTIVTQAFGHVDGYSDMTQSHYEQALVCENGHLITDALRLAPERAVPFCKKCGAPTLSTCPSCSAPI